MKNDGKSLEAFVATVEEILLPKGFTVTRGEKRFFESGEQEAEFDVVIVGKVGSATLNWLIECRDRPSQGAAEGSWIEQLSGRRSRFRFDKVTAVSTTGFTQSAIAAAKEAGIDLRTVADLDVATIRQWLLLDEFVVRHPRLRPHSTAIKLHESEPAGTQERVDAWLKEKSTSDPILRSSKTGELHSAIHALQTAVNDNRLFERMVPGDSMRTKVELQYQNPDDHYLLDLETGTVRVGALLFDLTISVEAIRVPMVSKREYRASETSETIAQVVAFGPMPFGDGSGRLEFHNNASGIHILLRYNSPTNE
jgi:hypothetical protein